MRVHLFIPLLLFAAAVFPATAADSEDAGTTATDDCRLSAYCVGTPEVAGTDSLPYRGAYVYGYCALNPMDATCDLDVVYLECNGVKGLQRHGAGRDCLMIL